MRIGIFENIMTPGGHEVDFDRILVEELSKLGHKVSFYVPKGFHFAMNYHVPVQELPGEVVSYAGVTGVRKLFRTVRVRPAALGGIVRSLLPESAARSMRLSFRHRHIVTCAH